MNEPRDERVAEYLSELSAHLARQTTPHRRSFAELAVRSRARHQRRRQAAFAIGGSLTALISLIALVVNSNLSQGPSIKIATDTRSTNTSTTPETHLEPGEPPDGFVVTSDQTVPADLVDAQGRRPTQRDIEYDGPGNERIVITIINNYEADLNQINADNEGRIGRVREQRASITERAELVALSWNDATGDYVQITGRNSALATVLRFAERMTPTP